MNIHTIYKTLQEDFKSDLYAVVTKPDQPCPIMNPLTGKTEQSFLNENLDQQQHYFIGKTYASSLERIRSLYTNKSNTIADYPYTKIEDDYTLIATTFQDPSQKYPKGHASAMVFLCEHGINKEYAFFEFGTSQGQKDISNFFDYFHTEQDIQNLIQAAINY